MSIVVAPNLVNVAQRRDALDLLRSLPPACSALVAWDAQHRGVLDHLKFGNEGARQCARSQLSAMSEDYIDACIREIARVLTPSGYCASWVDTFGLCEAHHLRVAGVLKAVDLIAWDSLRMGMGKRSRRRGDYLLVLQKPPIVAHTWKDHGIPSRWPEKVDRSVHPHIKPIGLISRIIASVTKPGDLVIDPAAGSFVVMKAALQLDRNFVGCDCEAVQSDAIDGVVDPDGSRNSANRERDNGSEPAVSGARQERGMNMNKFRTGYQRAEDLEPDVVSERVVAEVERVEFDDGVTKAVIHFENAEQSVVRNQTWLSTMIEAFGPNSDNWIGQTIRVQRGTTPYSGKVVPAIVIVPPEQAPKITAQKSAPQIARDKATIESGRSPDEDDIPFAPEWR
jgi:site-specific DNA-methyltransferase (adenine-specific)